MSIKKLLNWTADQVISFVELVRKYIRKMEKKIYGLGLPAPFGILILLIGVIIFAGGIAMLVLPGPGWVTIAFGIAIIRIGFNILTGNVKSRQDVPGSQDAKSSQDVKNRQDAKSSQDAGSKQDDKPLDPLEQPE